MGVIVSNSYLFSTLTIYIQFLLFTYIISDIESRTHPRQTLPRVDTSPSGHFPERTLPRADTSPSGHFPEPTLPRLDTSLDWTPPPTGHLPRLDTSPDWTLPQQDTSRQDTDRTLTRQDTYPTGHLPDRTLTRQDTYPTGHLPDRTLT